MQLNIIKEFEIKKWQSRHGIANIIENNIQGEDIVFFKCLRKNENDDVIEKERQILATLKGDCAPKFIGTCILDGNRCIITEYIPFPTFTEIRSNAKTDEQLKIVKQIGCEIVKTYERLMNKYGYIHEDLHQSNILCDPVTKKVWFIDNSSAMVNISSEEVKNISRNSIMYMYGCYCNQD